MNPKKGNGKTFESPDGFSIVELIISMAVISIVAIFIVIIAAQMLVFTGKTHSKDIALQLAESKVEELRSTLNIPDSAIDEPKPGYIRTVTSTLVMENSTKTSTIKFLREVTVTVRTPLELGAKTVTIVTYIQTYRPQISFILPVTAVAFGNQKDPVLEGTIRDDGYDIPISKVKYRLGNGSAWGSWAQVPNFYTDIGRNNPVSSPTLSWGITYYFTIPLLLSGDGNTTEIQVEATNTASIANIQPTTPLGGSSYVRLISDNTPPVISPANSPPYRPSITDTKPGFLVSVGVQDNLSGVLNCYLLLSKGNGGIQYWNESNPLNPTWSSTPFYSGMQLNTETPSIYSWPPTGTSTTPTITRGEIFRMTIYALDQTIGKYYDYLNKIPTHGVSVPTGEKIWPDVAANYSTYSVILPFVETLEANSKNPTKVNLRGECNTFSSTYLVYFQYWESQNPSNISYTPSRLFSSSNPVEFSEEVSLNPNISYKYRAICETPFGTFWGSVKEIRVIHVLFPNGGESWAKGDSKDLLWEAFGVSGNVNILLSRDGGLNWENLASNVPVTDGKFSWVVSGPETSSALIKIESTTHSSINDTSDAPFTIY